MSSLLGFFWNGKLNFIGQSGFFTIRIDDGIYLPSKVAISATVMACTKRRQRFIPAQVQSVSAITQHPSISGHHVSV